MMERAPGSGMPNPLKLVAREGMKHDGLSFQQSSACSPRLAHLDDSSHDTEDEGGHHHKGQRSHGSDGPLAWQRSDGEQQEGDTEQHEDGRAGGAGHDPADLLGGRNCLSSGGGQCIAQFRRVRITMSGSWDGVLARDRMRRRLALRRGQDPARGLGWAWEDVLARGYEGLAAKDSASPYVGGRTLKWLKVKQPKYREGERGWETGKS